ncbi:MAG TPA: hypothetical protein VEV15_04655 [Flavisolibacter sp.]|nr:hypothetical protein [Flavisolibacter sp.]
MTAKQLFTEKQYFRQVWVWIVLLSMNGYLIFALVKQAVLKQPLGARPKSTEELVVGTAIVLLVTLLIAVIRLETEIKEDGVYYRFFPFQLKMKRIAWDRISKAFVRQYKPLVEYGGWGIRIGIFGSGQAFNVSGNKGLQLIYDNGKKFLIGTQKPEALQMALLQIGRLSNEGTN